VSQAKPSATDNQANTDSRRLIPSIISPKGAFSISGCMLPPLTIGVNTLSHSGSKREHLVVWDITLSNFEQTRPIIALNYVSQSSIITTKRIPLQVAKGTYYLRVWARNLTTGDYDTTSSEVYVSYDCNSPLTDENIASLTCGMFFMSDSFTFFLYFISLGTHYLDSSFGKMHCNYIGINSFLLFFRRMYLEDKVGR
jgi:hypothetical protein